MLMMKLVMNVAVSNVLLTGRQRKPKPSIVETTTSTKSCRHQSF